MVDVAWARDVLAWIGLVTDISWRLQKIEGDLAQSLAIVIWTLAGVSRHIPRERLRGVGIRLLHTGC